ncbi:MAG: IPTL-CTERM sorting domain-containing protein [Burkholderiaceae bacterium]
MRFGHLALTLSRASALLLLCTTGFASPVTWTLNNVQTVGGVTVTGTFVYDADTNTYSNIDLTASNGKRFTALLKPPSNKTNNNEFLFFPHESPVVVGTSQAVGFANAVAKNNRGNAVTLKTASQQGGLFTCSSSNCLDVTPTGDAQWANGGTLIGVPQYPYVDSVSQTTGGAGGGNTVTLSGISFTGATDVKFGAQSAGAGNFTVVNDTTITVTTPAAAVGPVKVTVTNARGTAAASEAPTYTYFLPTAYNNRIVTSSSTPASITNALTTDVGVEVKGIYNYDAPRSEAATSGLNPRSTYRWALSTVNTGASQANANGVNATGNTLGGVAGGRFGITNLNAISYTPVSADLGKYLYYCVTAVSAPVGTAVLGAVGAETCSAAVPVGNPTAGVCGSAASVATATAPAANLCSVGTAGAVNVLGNSWSWSCAGTNGGNASPTCTAPFAAVNGGGGAVGAIQGASANNWQVRTADSGFVALPAAAPAGVTMPSGATKVVLDTGTPGTQTTVVLRFSSIPAGAQLYKYGKENGINDTPKWFPFPATIDRTAGTVTYTLTDGQKGDNDWTVNGVIDDPVGLGVGAGGVEGVPTLSQWAMLLMGGLVVLGGFGGLRRRLG